MQGVSVIKVFFQPGTKVEAAVAQLTSITQTILPACHATGHHPTAHRSVQCLQCADLSPIQCWREEGVGGQRRQAEVVGGARLDRVALSYWTEFDTVPRPAFQRPRPWDLMRKDHYLHVMFFRDRKSIDDQELWLKLPLEPFESAWVMTVRHTRDAVYGQTEQFESQTLHTFTSDRALADFCLNRLIRIAY
jgi:hypothetical protein